MHVAPNKLEYLYCSSCTRQTHNYARSLVSLCTCILVIHAELGQMTQLFVEALNSPGGVPVLGSTWDRVLETTYGSAMKGALQCYEGSMSSFRMPGEHEALLKCHRQAWDVALCKFSETLALDTDQTCFGKYLKQLKVPAQHFILVYHLQLNVFLHVHIQRRYCVHASCLIM